MTENLAALADIELPAPPDWRPLLLLAAAALLIALGGAAVYLRSRRGSRPAPGAESGPRAALQRLERLQQEWSTGAIDARAAAYRLAALLRLGLRLPQLHPATPPAGLDAGEWRGMLYLLHGLRYRPAPGHTLSDAVFARARDWLMRCVPAGGSRHV